MESLEIKKTPSTEEQKISNLFYNVTNRENDFSLTSSANIKITTKKSLFLTIFNIFRAFVAIGVLTLPYAIKLVGPIIGFFGQIFVAILVFLTTECLLEVANDSKFKGANYETLGKLVWGTKGKNLISILIYICSISTAIGAILFTTDFLDHVFCSHEILSFCNSKIKYLFFSLILALFIALIDSLKPFGYISIISTFVIIITIISITGYNFFFIFEDDSLNFYDRITYTNPLGFFSFLGIALYATEGIGLILPIRSSFKDNKNYDKVFYSTFVAILWCYLTLGIFSFLHFFLDTRHIIFFNFGKEYTYMLILEIVYAISIFLSFPISLFPIYESVYNTKKIKATLEKASKNRKFLIRYFIRVFITLICFFICLFLPNFIKFISFIGSFLFPIIGIYIPILLNYHYFSKKKMITKKKKIYLVVLFFIGIILFTCATIDSLIRKHE